MVDSLGSQTLPTFASSHFRSLNSLIRCARRRWRSLSFMHLRKTCSTSARCVIMSPYRVRFHRFWTLHIFFDLFSCLNQLSYNHSTCNLFWFTCVFFFTDCAQRWSAFWWSGTVKMCGRQRASCSSWRLQCRNNSMTSKCWTLIRMCVVVVVVVLSLLLVFSYALSLQLKLVVIMVERYTQPSPSPAPLPTANSSTSLSLRGASITATTGSLFIWYWSHADPEERFNSVRRMMHTTEIKQSFWSEQDPDGSAKKCAFIDLNRSNFPIAFKGGDN